VGNKERPAPLTLKEIMTIVQQIADALDCFASKSYTHRDVATRNCLITSARSVKITFASLCKTNYAAEYYARRDQVRVRCLLRLSRDKSQYLYLFFHSAAVAYKMASIRSDHGESVHRRYRRVFLRYFRMGSIHESGSSVLQTVEQRISRFAGKETCAMEITEIYASATGPTIT
jgi:serine/threonine protein kinase